MMANGAYNMLQNNTYAAKRQNGISMVNLRGILERKVIHFDQCDTNKASTQRSQSNVPIYAGGGNLVQ